MLLNFWRVYFEEDFMNIKEVDLAWIAGLLEGEGCFHLRGRIHQGKGTAKGNVSVQCHMTDKDVLEKLHTLVGRGNLNGPYKNGNIKNKLRYVFRVNGENAYELMKLVLPFMCFRRSEKINYLINLYESVPCHHVKNIKTNEVEEVTNLRVWCKTHNMAESSLYRTMAGDRTSCRGWVRID